MGRISYLVNRKKEKKRYHNSHRNPNVWVFGEWYGKRCCDNSLYLANYIASHYPERLLYWVAEKDANTSLLADSVRTVEMDSEECRDLLQNAGVVVMNQGLYDFSSDGTNYFSGAVTLNLWHGLMWKRIKYDAGKHNGLFAHIHHKMLSKLEEADYYLIPSEEMRTHFETGFLISKKNAVCAGYPRNMVFHDKEALEETRTGIRNRIVSRFGKCPQRIIAYMPTFRDTLSDTFSFSEMKDNERLNKLLEKYDALIIEKSHFALAGKSDETKGPGTERFWFTNEITATELLAAADMLITDYSSCFFDYLLLSKPIIHYIYDYDFYVNEDRGVYYSKEEMACGSTPQTIEELLDSMEQYLENPNKDEELRNNKRQLFWEYDSPNACEDIYRALSEILERKS